MKTKPEANWPCPPLYQPPPAELMAVKDCSQDLLKARKIRSRSLYGASVFVHCEIWQIAGISRITMSSTQNRKAMLYPITKNGRSSWSNGKCIFVLKAKREKYVLWIRERPEKIKENPCSTNRVQRRYMVVQIICCITLVSTGPLSLYEDNFYHKCFE